MTTLAMSLTTESVKEKFGDYFVIYMGSDEFTTTSSLLMVLPIGFQF